LFQKARNERRRDGMARWASRKHRESTNTFTRTRWSTASRRACDSLRGLGTRHSSSKLDNAPEGAGHGPG